MHDAANPRRIRNNFTMWNSNSRRWLVSKEEDGLGNHSPTTPRRRAALTLDTTSISNIKNTKPTATTIEHHLSPSQRVCSKEKSHIPREKATTSDKEKETAKETEIELATTLSISLEKGAPSRVRPCPNQIIVVMLNVLLANCLISNVANMPAAGAAFGAERPFIDEHNSVVYGGIGGQQQQGNFRHANELDAIGFEGGYGEQMSTANQLQLQRSQNFKISPKPCSIGRIEGTCMFVWECIKSEGRHVGMCVDSFMFGSCCSHNISDNIVMSQTFSYTRPTKPVGISSVNHKPRPPHFPPRPSISGMTTIERPHGAGTLVIRPSGPHHQGALFKPQSTKTKPTTTSTTAGTTTTTTTKGTTTTTTTKGTTTTTRKPTAATSTTLTTTTTKNPSLTASTDMQSAASIPASNLWHTSQQTTASHHWHMSTEPNFVTKPRPPTWEKPTSLRPKPPKPTKKPIVYDHQHNHNHHHHHPPHAPPPAQQQPPPAAATSTGKPTSSSATKPKPQTFTTRPMNTPTPTRPYFRPTSAWPSTTAPVNGTTSPLSSSLATTTQRYTSIPPGTTHYTTQHLETSTRPPAAPSASPSTPQQQLEHHQHPSTTISSISTAQTPAALNLNTVETNEIVEPDTKLATIKTITAARSECGIPVLARPETRIVGGKSAAFGRWPWQVSVRRTSFFGFSSTHRCGGALINENWIATAGHCVDDLLISQIRIRVGEYDFSHVQEQLPYIERGVVKKVVHPKYNFFTYEYDLALVKLEQPLEFAPHVSPICLPQTDSLMIGMNATVTGWGRLSEGGTLPSVLQEVTVPIVSNDNCKTMFLRAGRQEFIPDIFLCAGYETGGQDSCQGDSGGPLQVKSQDGRFFLAGIISWGIGCAEANLPGVCTRISKFVPWIMENVT